MTASTEPPVPEEPEHHHELTADEEILLADWEKQLAGEAKPDVHEEDDVTCPVCKTRTREEALSSGVMIWTLARAVADGDFDKVKLVQSTLTGLDAHTGASLLLAFVSMAADITGVSPNALLDAQLEAYRAALATEQAKPAG